MPPLDERVACAGAMWGGADYERIAKLLAGVHDDLVRRLAPRPGERWLDVATGTGEVALRAARAGALVTALDIAPELLEQARAKAEAERLEIEFDVADAQRLSCDGESFDVVSSVFGVIFAPDARAAAAELARVCRRGGRLGLTAWREKAELRSLYERFQSEPPSSNPDAWSSEQRVLDLLGEAFELQFDEGTWRLSADSPEAAWDFMTTSAPPTKAFVGSLDDETKEEFRRAYLNYWERQRTGDGVSEERRYLVVTGRRR